MSKFSRNYCCNFRSLGPTYCVELTLQNILVYRLNTALITTSIISLTMVLMSIH